MKNEGKEFMYYCLGWAILFIGTAIAIRIFFNY